MGAGTSTEQGADKPNEEQVEQCIDLGQQEQDGQEVEVSTGGDAKLLHTNGKIAIINGAADEGEGVGEGLQGSDVNGHGIEEIIAVVKEVEQQEPASVTLDEEPTENMGIVHNDTTTKETAKEDGEVETPEATEITPESEEKAESPDQANENQSNEVGFKKVFKFVGFKFTVKKDKTAEKSEPVKLLTVKKDEVEVNGTDNHEEHIDTADEGKKEIEQETKDCEQPAESADKPAQAAESPKENPEEDQKKVEESEVENDQKSPTNPLVTETSSPFRRFFTQGWAGLRKKTSFKKSVEEDPQEVQKHIKVEEQDKAEVPEALKEKSTAETQPASDESVPQELSKSASEDSKVSTEENSQTLVEEKPKQEEPSPANEAELKLEEAVKVNEMPSPVAEDSEHAPEVVSSVAEAAVLLELKTDADTLEDNVETQITDGIAATNLPAAEGISEDLQGISGSGDVDNDQPQLVSSTECGELEKSQEAITTEAELLSSQEKAKIQGSPLKKLFSSSGLRKLSGKKSKSKKEDDSKVEVTSEAVSSVSPETPEIDGGDSSPSSPEESAETSPTDKLLDDVQHTTEADGEGTTSDGERKKDGITPWASFKKLVTPKRRPKRPSESDKEDEVEKAKTSTMSSTDSAGTVENQEEPKETNEDQKLEKSTEESKKKVDSSVSWEALICVGSSKKRGRKTSDSDEDEGVKLSDEDKKTEDVVPAKETDSDSPMTSSQEQQIQESTSPDQAGSPSEADGVSTWQSFKRLVTPRRKSRTREEKTDETANAEQSTSEGEAGKEETWVSFKKLIPGRKKKKSDGKQEHPLTSETGQPLRETAEDDSDEPAVVPLAEFDAAEQEKLDAQKSLEEALPTVLGEQKEALENANDELIHAVTVTVIEGERAITSLEERSPSWISATVSETIEHAKETKEAIERIKTEVVVEETVVLSTVSKVMTEMPKAIINEMELTSEALTALEEAIENSCAEETTEMISAVSQLGGSVVSTEEATPVPEEDASVKTLEEQKKHTENVLHEAAEKAKLTIDTLQLQTSQNVTDFSTSDIRVSLKAKDIVCDSAPLCTEEQISLTPISSEDQDDKSTIVSAEETVEQICISVIEKAKESVFTSETVQNEVNAPIVTLDQTDIICVSPSISKEEQADTSIALLSAEKTDKHVSIPFEDQAVKETQTCNDAEVITLKREEKGEDASDSIVIESVVQESTSALDAICAKDELLSAEDVTASHEVQPEEVVPVSSEVQPEDVVPVSSEVQPEEVVPVSSEVEPEEVVPVSSEVQPEEVVPVSSEVQPEEVVHVSSEVQLEEVVPELIDVQPEEAVRVASEVQPQEVVSVSSEVQSEDIVPVSSEVQTEEVVPVSREEKPEEVVPVSSEEKSEEVVLVSREEKPEEVELVSSKVELKEVVLVSSEKQPEEVVPVSSEEQSEEVVSVSREEQPEKVVPVSSEKQAEEVVPVSSEKQPEEVVPVSSEKQPEDVVPVSSEKQPEEVVPVSSEKQPEEVVPVSSEKQPKEVVPESREEQPEKVVPASSEKQPKEVVPESREEQPEKVVPVSSEKQPEEVVPVSSEEQSEEVVSVTREEQPEKVVPVSSEKQPEKVVPVSSEKQPEKVVPVSSEKQPEEVLPVSSEVQPEEVVSVSREEQPEKVVPVSSEKQPKEVVPVSREEQPKEVVPVSSKKQPEEVVPVSSEVQSEEVVSVSREEQPEEVVPVSSEKQTKEVVPVSRKEQPTEVVPVSSEKQPEEVVPVSSEVQPEEVVSVSREEQPEEVVPVSSEKQPEEVVPVSSEVQPEEVVPVSKEEQPKEVVPVSREDQPKEVVPVSSEKQPKEVVPVSREEQPEKVAPVLSEAQPEEVVPVSRGEQTEEVVPLSSEVQPEEVLSVSREEQPEEVVPVSSEKQTEEVVPVSSEVQPEEVASVSREEQPEEVVPVSRGEQTEEVVPVSSEDQPDKVVLVSSEVQIKESESVSNDVQVKADLSASNELQLEVGYVNIEVKNEEVHSSEVQKAEEVISVCSDLKDESGILASTKTSALEEVEAKGGLPVSIAEQNKECARVSVEVHSVKIQNVPVEEHTEENVSISDEKGISVPGEVQANESVLVADEVQVAEGAGVLAEAKVDSTPVLAELNTENVAPVSTDMRVEEQATESVGVRAEKSASVSIEALVKENVQAEEGANLTVDVQAKESSSVPDELQAAETSPGPDEKPVEERVQKSDEVLSTEVTPVLLAEEVVQVDGIGACIATEELAEQITPVVTEQKKDEQSEVSNVQAGEVIVSVQIQNDGKASASLTEKHKEPIEDVPTLNEVDTAEKLSKLVENDAQESEKVLGSSGHEESFSDNQTQKLTTEEAVAETNVLIAVQETTALHSENTYSNGNNTEIKDTPPSTAQEEAKESGVECKDKITHSQEKIVEVKEKEEVVTINIPALESSEAIKVSEPVTAAAVEEQVLAETVKTIEIPKYSIKPLKVTDTKSEDNEVSSKALQVVVESVSQKAAAIVDAAIEAATNCFVVDATSQGDTLEETTISEKVEPTKETDVQTISIESCSTTIVKNIIETAVETVVSNIHIKETVNVQRQNLENELDSQPIKSCSQLEESEQKMTEGVQNTRNEIESAVPAHTEVKIDHQISTQASEVNAQEKAPTVES